MNCMRYSSAQQVLFNTLQRMRYLRRALFLLSAAFGCAPLWLLFVDEVTTPALIAGVVLQVILGMAWFDTLGELHSAAALVRRLEEAGRRINADNM